MREARSCLDLAFKSAISLEPHQLSHLQDEEPGQINFAVRRGKLRKKDVKGDGGLGK